MQFQIKKATKEQLKARIGLIGPSGAGKTYTALALACGLGERVVVIDTENASASKYADKFNFDVLVLDNFAPQTYVEAIHYCEAQGHDVIVIDSLSHAWMGKGGMLEQKDRAAKKPGNNDFSAWRDVTPFHNALVNALVWCKRDLIITMRTKTEYVMEVNDKGRTAPRKIGTTPVQRDGLEYEFDIVADIDIDHNLVITKTRCEALDGLVVNKAGVDLAYTIREWLSVGVVPEQVESIEQPPLRQANPPIPPIAKYREAITDSYLVLYPQAESPEIAFDWANQHFFDAHQKYLEDATEDEVVAFRDRQERRVKGLQAKKLKTEVIA